MELRLSVAVSKGKKFYVARGIEIELASQGKTVEEALKNLKKASELWARHAQADELETFSKESPIVTNIVVSA